MRMSRWEWLARIFRPAPRVRIKRPKRERKKPRPWLIIGPAGSSIDLEVLAHTKSEARAIAKEKLGYKDRLPVGTVGVDLEKRRQKEQQAK